MAARYLDSDDDVVLGPPGHYSDDPPGGVSDQNDDVEVDAASPRGAATGKGAKGDDQPAKPKRAAKPRPKLTMDLLQESHGLNAMFNQFPGLLRTSFKGKGHEVADLQRVLEMYSRWHQRLFPHCSFDEFIARIEKFSSTNVIKSDMRGLRQQLILLLDDDKQPEAEDQARQEVDAAQTSVQPQASPAAASAQAVPSRVSRPLPVFDDEDDELVYLQQQQAEMQWEAAEEVMDEVEVMKAAPSSRGPGPAPVSQIAAAQAIVLDELPGAADLDEFDLDEFDFDFGGSQPVAVCASSDDDDVVVAV